MAKNRNHLGSGRTPTGTGATGDPVSEAALASQNRVNTTITGIDIEQQQVAPVSGGGIPLAFYATPGTGATATAMNRPGSANTSGVEMPFRGSITAISVSGSAAKAGGTASFTVYVSGTATSATHTWTNVQREYTLFAKDTAGFAAGDYLDVRFTTDGSYTPTTTVVEVMVWVSVDQSTID